MSTDLPEPTLPTEGDVGADAASTTLANESDETSGWHRLRVVLMSRPGRGQLVIAVLCALLGFGIVLQVQAVRTDEVLVSARPEDLVQLLDSLDQRNERLDAELSDLRTLRDKLVNGQDSQRAAAAERAARENELGILAGTVAATGPGIVVRMTGPVSAELLLDTVQELRDAGAEAIQIGDVRVVAQTAFVPKAGGGVLVDGALVGGSGAQVEVKAIGDPSTLATSLQIPGGVVDSARTDDVRVVIVQSSRVTVSALRPLTSPDYARSGS